MTKVLKGYRHRILFHPSMIAHTLVLLALVTSLMILAFRSAAPQLIIITFAIGWTLWTFAEYALNRWLLHAGEASLLFVAVFKRHHFRHHEDPENIRYSFPHPLTILITAAILFLLALLTLGTLSFSLTSGFLFGCWLFCLLHVLQHHYPSPSAVFLKNYWQTHFLHHNRYSDKAFGISTPLWDRMLGTLPPRHLFLDIQPAAYRADSRVLRTMQVEDRRSEETFLNVPETILGQDKHWIPHLRSEVKSIFDPARNPYFQHGTARRWILVTESGEVIGRIAAFINFKKMYEGDRKIGCIGFFECVNNREAAFILFDTAIQWLVERYQVSVIDGPVNFGENDKYWGLLVKGFTPPSYGMNYNPPYYQDLFESYGFRIQYRQLTTRVDLGKPFPERVYRIAERVITSNKYTFKPFRYADQEKFIKDFVDIYNQAWASFKNFQPMEADVVRKSLSELKPIINDSLIWFAYAGNNAVGFLMAVPDLNEIVKYTDGRLNMWGTIKLLFYKHWKGFSCLRVIVMGIVPEFQQRGLESALIVQAYEKGKANRYKHVELAWVGDFNDKMIAVHKAMGAVEDKQHATFRKDVCGEGGEGLEG